MCMLEKPPGADRQRTRSADRGGAAGRANAVCDLAFAFRAGRRAGARVARQPPDQVGDDQMEGRRQGLASRPGLDLGAGRVRRVRSRHQRALDPDPHSAAAVVPDRGRAVLPAQSRRPRSPPISTFSDDTGVPIDAEFDLRQTGPQTWDIRRRNRCGADDAVVRRRPARGDDGQTVADAKRGGVSRASIGASSS